MPESIIQQFLNHPYRIRYVWGAALLLAMLLGFPAYDELGHAGTRQAEIQAEIDETAQSLQNVGPLKNRLAEVERVAAGDHKTVDSQTAQQLREDVVRLVHEQQCRLLHVQLSDPQAMPWSKDADPLATQAIVDKKAKYDLVKTKLNVTAEGSLKQIDQLVDEIGKLHELAVPTQMILRERGDQEIVKIDIELTLLDLHRHSGK